MRGVFVTGTDTDVGKTVVSATLMLGLDGRYWKPVQAGTQEPTDTDRVREWTALPADRFLPEAYRLSEPMSPHAAAALDGIDLDVERIAKTEMPADRPLIVEGAGGLMVPLAPGALMIDLIGKLRLPTVIVARTSLGTLNHTLLSLEALRAREITILGVVLNGDEHESNRLAVESYGHVPVLGTVPRMERVDPDRLLYAFRQLTLPSAIDG